MRHISVAMAALLVVAAGLNAEVPSAIAIKDAHVVRVSGEDLPKATILLRDGLIQDVGANLPIPADAWVIDGSGLTVYPGFIDGLSNWGLPGTPPTSTARAGTGAASSSTPSTTAAPRSHGPEDRPQTYSYERAADLVTPSDHRLEAARAAGFTSAATFPDRGIFEGLGALIDLAGERGRDMVIAQPIGQQITFRVGGLSRGGFPSSLMGNIAYVRQLYLDLDQYQKAKQIYAANPSGNRRPEYDHALEGLAESPRVLLPAEEMQQIDRVLNFGWELKMPFVLYGLHEAYRSMDELKQANVPLLVSLEWPERPRDADPNEAPNYRELEMRDKAPAVPGMLAKAGLKFGFYSDGVDTAPGLKSALKKAIDAGLPRADAIRALTLSVAEIYGVADRVGSIDRGKIANLVVTKGEAFDEKSSVEYVFIDGKEFQPSKEIQQPPPSSANSGGHRPGVPEEPSDGGQN
ncbi:MAG TPA: amidohydrolase family protein [Bryobacteraceae bacterium]